MEPCERLEYLKAQMFAAWLRGETDKLETLQRHLAAVQRIIATKEARTVLLPGD